ncbi:MAG TPA: DUF2884 family protein [Dokdonella sp.]
MKRLFAALVLGAACASAAHADIDLHGDDCGLHSDYSLGIEPSRLVFSRAGGDPAEVVVADGSLRIDGRAVALDAADRERLRTIERGVREAVPEVKTIARDAVAIVIAAVGQVSAAFARDAADARASAERLARSARELDRRIADSTSFADWQDADLDRVLESAVGTLVGEVVGDVAGRAISVALSGDEHAAAELEARAAGLEKDVDRAVERHSAELKRRAAALCPRLRTLARLGSELDVRLDGGRRLELIRFDGARAVTD